LRGDYSYYFFLLYLLRLLHLVLIHLLIDRDLTDKYKNSMLVAGPPPSQLSGPGAG
jgi:hypothetical protein